MLLWRLESSQIQKLAILTLLWRENNLEKGLVFTKTIKIKSPTLLLIQIPMTFTSTILISLMKLPVMWRLSLELLIKINCYWFKVLNKVEVYPLFQVITLPMQELLRQQRLVFQWVPHVRWLKKTQTLLSWTMISHPFTTQLCGEETSTKMWGSLSSFGLLWISAYSSFFSWHLSLWASHLSVCSNFCGWT